MDFGYLEEDLKTILFDRIFTDEDINEFVNFHMHRAKLDDYIKKIIIKEEIDGENLSVYNLKTRELTIYRERIIKDAEEWLDDFKRDFDSPLSTYFMDEKNIIFFINLNILNSLVHELCHVVQNKIIHTCHSKYQELIEEEYLFYQLEPDYYEKYYQCFTFEREAIACSFEAILLIIRQNTKDNCLFDFFLEEFKYHLVSGYTLENNKLTAPAEVIQKGFLKIKKIHKPSDDIYEKLKFGYPIPKKTYQDFLDNGNHYISEKLVANKR